MNRTYKTRIAKPNLPKKARNDAKSESSTPTDTWTMGIDITPRVRAILSRPHVDMDLVMLELTAITNTQSSTIEYQRLDEIRSTTIKTKTTTKTNTKTNEIWSTTIKPAELDQADGLFDDENHELLSAPNTTPRPTGVRS
jgi:hypothetical protein